MPPEKIVVIRELGLEWKTEPQEFIVGEHASVLSITTRQRNPQPYLYVEGIEDNPAHWRIDKPVNPNAMLIQIHLISAVISAAGKSTWVIEDTGWLTSLFFYGSIRDGDGCVWHAYGNLPSRMLVSPDPSK